MLSYGEFDLIEKIKERFGLVQTKNIGIGDDAAVLDNNMLVTTDALVDQVHFDTAYMPYREIGYKSVAVNLSDIAAMGGEPHYLLMTLGIPSTMTDEDMDNFISGVSEARSLYAFDLMGGDIVRSQNLFISVTAVGKPFGKPLLRGDAKNRDYIYVTGTLGDSAIGLKVLQKDMGYHVHDEKYFIERHYRPKPRMTVMEYLQNQYKIHACIDISDGFLGDFEHIAQMSRLNYFIDIGLLPLSVDRIGDAYQKDRAYFEDMAMNGGEDYELIFTSPELIDSDKIEKITGVRVSQVGYMTHDESVIQWNGRTVRLEDIRRSYRHY